jgi:hypothetical protein
VDDLAATPRGDSGAIDMTNARAHLLSALLAAVLVVLAIGSVDESDADGDDFSMPPMLDSDGREIAPPPPPSRTPPPAKSAASSASVRTDLRAVLEDLASDRWSDDQRTALFEREYENQWFVIEGLITDVGTWIGDKYVTIRVGSGGLCDVYLPEDFDILSVRKGSQGRYAGRFDFVGDGELFNRQFRDGRRLD